MRFWLSVAAALLLSGCALLRHDAIVRGVFPEDSAFDGGITIAEDWAK